MINVTNYTVRKHGSHDQKTHAGGRGKGGGASGGSSSSTAPATSSDDKLEQAISSKRSESKVSAAADTLDKRGMELRAKREKLEKNPKSFRANDFSDTPKQEIARLKGTEKQLSTLSGKLRQAGNPKLSNKEHLKAVESAGNDIIQATFDSEDSSLTRSLKQVGSYIDSINRAAKIDAPPFTDF